MWQYFIRRLCTSLFAFLVMLRCLLGLDCHIIFDPLQIKSMILLLSMLLIWKHESLGRWIMIICRFMYFVVLWYYTNVVSFSQYVIFIFIKFVLYQCNLYLFERIIFFCFNCALYSNTQCRPHIIGFFFWQIFLFPTFIGFIFPKHIYRFKEDF